LEARAFLHEYDHMEGSNFTKRVSKLKLDIALRRARKVSKQAKILENRPR
jgi:peptide deformylase